MVFTGSLWLICKGADTAVFERTASGDANTLECHLNEFAEVCDLIMVSRSEPLIPGL